MAYKAFDVEQLRAGYQPYEVVSQTPQAQPQKKKRNFWLDQISTATGIAGGIGGGILGAAAGGIGAVPGAAVGGGAGSALGEAIENLIDPQGGDWGNVAEEGALGAVFSAGPGVVRSGIQAVKGVGKAAAKEGAEGVTKRTARGLLGDAWGLRPGVKVNGKIVTPQRASELQEFVVKQVGVPKTANADMVFSKLTTFQDDAGKAISSAVKTNATPLNTSGLASSLQGKFSKVIGANAKDNPIATDILTQVKSAKTPEQLWQVRRNIDDSLISFSRNPNAAVPGAEQFARSARTEINKVLNKAVPGLSGLNKGYSKALDATELVANATRTPKGLKLPGFLGSVGGGGVQRGRAAIGNTMGAAANIGRGAGNQAITPKGVIGRNIAGSLLTSGSGQEQMTPEQSLEEALMTQGGGMEFGGMGEPEPQEVNPYPRENLLADIQRDPANAQDYMKQYAMFQELFAAPEVKPLGSEAQKRALTAESGLRSLDQLLSTLDSDPGAFQRQALPNPFGITARLTGTTDVRAATDNVVDVLARLRSGAAITDAEAARFARLLPQPGDSQESALKKIRNVAIELQSFATNPGGGAGLEDALMQYQTQGQGF